MLIYKYGNSLLMCSLLVISKKHSKLIKTAIPSILWWNINIKVNLKSLLCEIVGGSVSIEWL